ncbi:hypothetical protein [Hamadaea tsunoensis]|uniref:hypothetical protein n=1 Tax=Hamadaea tsunoensis TaxID=53368 RepID=UPI00041233D5|nr:hypothetical protein [Hamadaea tsunoensis]
MDVVELWTGRHANALRLALRLTNEAMARQLGTAVRTVAKWNAEPEVVPSPELQRALDTMLSRATDDERRRLGLVFAATRAEREIDAASETRLATDDAANQALSWLDEAASWTDGSARRLVARLAREVDPRRVQDLARARSRVSRNDIAKFLRAYYDLPAAGYGAFRASVGGIIAETSVLTRPDWLDLKVRLGDSLERFVLDDGRDALLTSLDRTAAEAAAQRLAVGLATGGRLVNSTLYRLTDLVIRRGGIEGAVALTDFVTYALTMDLLEGETIDAIVANLPPEPDSTPLRAQFLPTVDSVIRFGDRLCAGGPLALFAAARPATRTRRKPDFVLLVQQRSGRVLNAAHRLAVIPKAFHQPMVDLRAEAAISMTLNREMEEELFGRPEVDSTGDGFRLAEPLHPSRLTPPFRALLNDMDNWRMECSGFGLNLVSGNFEFASVIVIEDEDWWHTHGGSIQANWEADGLRQYSSLDRELIAHLVHDASWSNEGLFAFLQGLRRLAEIGGDRVDLPAIEWEL